MYAGRDFSPSDVGESEIYSFDFSKDCAAGETLTSAIWHCTVAEGSDEDDAEASSRLSGSSSNSGTVSSQRVVPGVAGVKYVLQAVAVTNQGNTKSLWSHVLCGAPE